MTVREFIELYMELYRLGSDSDTFKKIKAKVTRELQKIESWHKLEDKKVVGKTSAYLLDYETKEQLEKVMKPYFLKLSKISPEDFEKQLKLNEKKADNISDHINSTSEDEAYFYEVPKSEQLFVMIEALFNEKFELDKKSWNDDYTNYHLFINDEYALPSDSLVLSNLRLQNPIKYYVKKR